MPEQPTVVNLWKGIGGYMYLLKIGGRWYWLGDRPGDLVSWLARHPEVRVVRQGGDRVVAAAYAKHGATLAALKRTFRPVSKSTMP